MRGKEKGWGKGGAAATGGTLLKGSGGNRGRRGRFGVSVCVEEREGRRGAWCGGQLKKVTSQDSKNVSTCTSDTSNLITKNP
jgi:hypothetical protein